MKKEIKYFSNFTEENFKRLTTHPYFAKTIESIKKNSEKYMSEEPSIFKFSDAHGFYTNEKSEGEAARTHNEYVCRLNNHYFMYLYTREEKYLTALMNIMWNICDLEGWDCVGVLMAEDLPLKRRRCALTLASIPIGARLAEIVYTLEDELPELVVRRVKHEVRERIIESYANTTDADYWWMRTNNNWAASCGCNLIYAHMYAATREEFDKQIPRIMGYLERYMTGFDDEGCCYEGYHYWKFGMWTLCLAAEGLYEYSDGKINLFENPKFIKMAKFQENASINSKEAIPFGDSEILFIPSATLSHKLKTMYPEVQIPSLEAPANSDGSIRPLLWLNPDFANFEMKPKSTIYNGAQWFIYRSDAYNFAAKAGYNGESHNHNDVGTFVISKNDKVTFTDAGAGNYTQLYFAPETRYKHMITSSRGHSAPIINGEYQVTGDERCRITIANENEYAFNMQNAYGVESLKTLNRHFVCEADGISLTDTYEFSETPVSVTERFISLKEPKITDDGVVVGDSILTFDKDVFYVSVDFAMANSMDENDKTQKGRDFPIYYTDLKVKNPETKMQVNVKFR